MVQAKWSSPAARKVVRPFLRRLRASPVGGWAVMVSWRRMSFSSSVPSFAMRVLALCRAALKYSLSFMRRRAWRGVLVRSRRAMQASRLGASKMVIWGGDMPRFQKE